MRRSAAVKIFLDNTDLENLIEQKNEQILALEKKLSGLVEKIYPEVQDLENEIWKDIEGEGVDGLYQVSNFGRVKSFHSLPAKLITPYVNYNGYYVVEMRKDKKKITRLLHRLIAKAFIPNPENKPYINHKDGNKLNYSLENLEWVTSAENTRHARENGLMKIKRGTQCSHAKFTETEIKYIRKNYNPSDKKNNANSLAKKFGVSTTTIYYIVHEKIYKDVE